MGYEDELVEELRAVVQNHRPSTHTYLTPFGGPNYYNGITSQNWTILARSIRYQLDPGAERAVLIAEEFPYQRRCFMGSELFSTCHKYGMMHVGAWAGIVKKSREVGDLEVWGFAKEWLRYWVAVQLMREVYVGGPVLIAGMRSAGHPAGEGDLWARWVLALLYPGEGRSLAAATSLLKARGMAPGNSYKSAVVMGCLEALQDAVGDLGGKDSFAEADSLNFSTITPMHVLSCKGTVAVTWVERNCNGNTGPVMASWGNPSGVSVIPPDGGGRTRRWVEAQANEVSSSVLAVKYDDQLYNWTLPCLDDTRRFVSKSQSSEVGSPYTPEPPLPPNSDVPDALQTRFLLQAGQLGMQPADFEALKPLILQPEYERAAHLLETIQVPRKNLGLRARLIAELASVRDDD